MWGFASATDRGTKLDRWATWIQRRGRGFDLTPRRVTLVYLVFGLAALLGSDVLLVQQVPEPRLSQLQALKGGVEVLLTGGLIYVLTRGSRASLHRTNSQLDAARRELGVLHRVLRHNLRNDLTVILGYVNQIETSVADPDVERYCERITATCNEFVRSADKTKHLAELHANGLRTTDVDLATILDRIRTDGRRRYPRATIEVEQPVHPVVQAHEHLDFALRELVDNAIVHNPASTPVVRVRTEVDASDPTRTRIHVEDTGPGIPEPELEALHQPEEAPLVHGSGVGLWVARWIVLRSNGSFEIANTEAGCRVTVTLRTSRPRGSRSGTTPIERFLE